MAQSGLKVLLVDSDLRKPRLQAALSPKKDIGLTDVLLVNTSNQPQTAQIGIRGFPVLREARLRLFDDPQQSVRFTTLPKSPFQTVKLAPYAVAIVQFIEPPK